MDNNQLADRHLFIAGTGRAGTSFLVRYLSQLGLDTHLGRHADPAWDENANAGLEDAPVLGSHKNLPYVIKSPWLYEYIDEIIENGTFQPDAVIIPVRDLAEAAISRSVLERRAIHQNAPWMSELNSAWEQWAHVPGGIVYSLNPIDQGRLLAVGFHHLVQRLVAADIPIIFLTFPRLIEDADYVFDKLHTLLPAAIDRRTARAAHQRVTDSAKVRVGDEVDVVRQPVRPETSIVNYATPAELNAIALRREVGRLRQQLEKIRQEESALAEQQRANSSAAAEERHLLTNTIGKMETILTQTIAEREQVTRDRDAAVTEIATLRARLRDTEEAMSNRVTLLQDQSRLEQQQRATLEDSIARIYASRSWRMTRIYRAVGSFAQRLRRRI